MPWKLKSDKTGKVYTFGDDVGQDDALDYMDAEEAPAKWGDVLNQAWPEAKRGAASAVAGLRQGAEDLGLAEPGEAAMVRKQIALEREEELPKNMSLTQRGVLGGVASTPEMAVSLIPGLGVGAKALSAKRALTLGLAPAVAMESAREYGEQREAGIEPLRSLGHAGVAGAAEAIGERLPLKYAFDTLGEKAFGKFLGGFIGRDIVGEELTYAIQSANEKLSRTPDMTMGEFAEGLYTTAVGAAVGSGIIGAGLKATDVGIRAAGQVLSDMEMRDTLTRFVEMEGQERLPDAVPLTDPEHTKSGTAELNEAIQRFRAEEVPNNVWSEFATQYVLKTGVQTAPAFEDFGAAQDWLTQQVVEAPNTAHQTILANLDKLAEAGVDIPVTIAKAANGGQITAAQATSILEKSTATVDQLVSAMTKETARAISASKTEQNDFAQRVLESAEEWEGTEVGQITNGFAQAVSAMQTEPDRVLTYQDMVGFGIPADFAEGIMWNVRRRQEAAPHASLASVQKSILTQAVTTLGDFLYAPPNRVGKTSLARIGDFANAFTGLVEPIGTWTNNKYSEAAGKTIDFGPNRGRPVRDGFIHTTKAGDVDAVNNGVEPRVVKQMTAIMRRWIHKYAPGMNVVLVVKPRVRGDRKLGHQMYMERTPVEGRTAHEIVITVNPDNPMNDVMTLSHEFGHALFIRQFSNATPQMREVLRQEWVKWTMQHWNKSQAEMMAGQRPDTRTTAVDYRSIRELVKNQVVGDTLAAGEHELLDYWSNFLEWHAHMMERMLVADYAEMQTPVRQFFRKVWAELKRFFTNEHKLWAPNQTVEEWLAIMARNEQALQIATQRFEQEQQAFDVRLHPNQQVRFAQEDGQLRTQEAMFPVTPATENLAPISAPNQRQAEAAVPTSASTEPFIDSIKKVSKLIQKANPQQGPEVAKSLVKFNEMWAYLLGSFQVLELNKGVPGATRFLNALRAKFGYKSIWLRGANQTANLWEGLGKERAGALAKLLLTEAETDTWFSDWKEDPTKPGHYQFLLDPDKATEFKIDEETAAVYQQVRDMYMRALDAMEMLGRERIVRQFSDDPSNPQMDAQLRELETSYANMRDRPYTPFSRFGKFYVKIKARDNGIFKDPVTGTSKFYAAGQTVYFETFETALERDNALPELQKRYGKSPMLDAQFNTGKIHDIVYSVRNLPPQFVRSIADRLGLDAEQLREYNEIVKDLASDSSFVKHMKRKANISGYSPDTLRGFADYFLRFSNNYAKGRSAPEFEAAMADVREYKRTLENSEIDTTKLDEFYNWLQRTFNYVMNPGNELAELKSFVTGWYLGFNIPTAVQNITQLPFWTLPYLSKRFGTVSALSALKSAVKDTVGSWKNMTALSADEKAMMTHALEQGFVDESFATSIAQFAEGTALSRLTATATRHRLMNWYNHKALYMFQLAEEINRRASLLAAYRLNRNKDFSGEFDANAFLAARETVEVTQNEYALENRPEFMRGNKSVIFQFMHYVQNAIFRMTPWGDDAWMRFLLMQLSVGGLLGLPFAEDLLNAVKFLARKFGIHVEPEMELSKLVAELGIAPDWVLRGAASHVGPFDLSYRYSLGQVIPGMQAIGSNRRFNDAILDAVGDVGGAGSMIMLNALKAVASLEDPNKLKTAQYVSPSFVKYGLQALDASQEGGVIARNGALIAPLEQEEILGMGIGMQPRAKSHAYKKIGYESEVRNYWMTRRAVILDNMYQAVRTRDREALADMRKRIKEFNAEVRKVEPKMIISARTVQSSVRGRMRAAKLQEKTGSPHRMPTLQQSIEAAVPPESDGDEALY